MDNIALGPGIGVVLGVAIGAAVEKQHAHELRPLTKKELETKKQMIILVIVLIPPAIFWTWVMCLSNGHCQ